MFKKIIMGTDFSPASEQVYGFIDELKELGLQELILVHVLPEGEKGKRLTENAQEKLSLLEKKFNRDDLRVRAVLSFGIPAFQLKEISEREETSLVVLGSRGNNPIREFFLGSTVLNFLRITSQPTLIVKYQELIRTKEKKGLSRFSRILLPVDFSKDSMRVNRWVIKNIKSYVDEFIIVHVCSKGTSRDELKKWKLYAEEELGQIEKEFTSDINRVKTCLKEGFPAI